MLSDLTVSFLGPDEVGWIQLLGRTLRASRAGPLLQFKVSTLVNDPTLAARLELQLASVSITFLHRAILECVYWGENMGRMTQSRALIGVPGGSEAAAFRSRKKSAAPRPAPPVAPPKGDGVLFVVKIDNPYVIIPQDSFQPLHDPSRSNQMEVDLGTIFIDNKLVSLKKAMGTRRASRNKRQTLVDMAVAKSRKRTTLVTAPLVSVRSRRVIDGKITKRTDQTPFPMHMDNMPGTRERGSSTGAGQLDVEDGEEEDDELEVVGDGEGDIGINRLGVSVSEFTVAVRCGEKIYEFVKKTGATFVVDLPLGDKNHTLPEATVSFVGEGEERRGGTRAWTVWQGRGERNGCEEHLRIFMKYFHFI
jgi:hypothetical protein